jgi:hypothetical protein
LPAPSRQPPYFRLAAFAELPILADAAFLFADDDDELVTLFEILLSEADVYFHFSPRFR